MSDNQNGDSNGDVDFAQAFKDLARGERAAAALEGHLDSLEKKIEDMLAKAEEDERNMKAKTSQHDEKASLSERNNSAAS